MGFAYKHGNRWLQVCSSTACMRRLGLESPVAQGVARREITEDGRIIMPFDREALTLLRAMPGARWNPEQKLWTASISPENIRRTLEIAEQLQLTIPDSLRKIAEEGTIESREAKQRASHEGLYEFQRAGVEFLALHQKALLADDMGLGKTVQSLVALPKQARTIIISPAAVKYNWMDEAAKWRPELSVTVCSGRNSFQIPKENEVVIINFDILPDWLMLKNIPVSEAEALKGVTLVVDECHQCKNYKTKRSQKVQALGNLCERTWFLTGTPLLNRPQDLFGVLSCGNMRVLGGWEKFTRLYDALKNKWGGWEFGLPSPEVPERLKRVMLRRIRGEVLKDLPGKTYQTITLNNLGESLRKQLDKISEDFMDDAGEFDLANLPSFEQFSAIRAKLAMSKLTQALEIVEEYEESDTPLVIFSAHRAPILEIGSRSGWAAITGETPALERRNIVKMFQDGQLKGIALTIQAGGVGLTLTRAAHALFIDLDWTPAMNMQAEDRLCRIGQTKPVQIIHLQTNHPLDIHIQSLIRQKMILIQRSIDASLKFKPPKFFDQALPEVTEETDEQLAERLAALRAAEEEAEREHARSRVHSWLSRELAKSDIPEPPLTMERKELLRGALDWMCNRCDGARKKDGMGFNKPDAAMAHWIHRTGMTDNDEVTWRVTERILSRYYRQMRGIFEAIWKPE